MNLKVSFGFVYVFFQFKKLLFKFMTILNILVGQNKRLFDFLFKVYFRRLDFLELLLKRSHLSVMFLQISVKMKFNDCSVMLPFIKTHLLVSFFQIFLLFLEFYVQLLELHPSLLFVAYVQLFNEFVSRSHCFNLSPKTIT